MFKKLSVVICGLGVVMTTAGAATAQTATQEAKDKTKAAASKTATVMTDAEITSAVKTKLLADKTVGGLKIDVDTSNGVVTLTGPVNSAAERNEALRLARTTKGVKHVVNKLTMDTAATAGHKDTTAAIKDDTKEAATKTKEGAVKAGKATEHGAEKAGKATEHGAEKAGKATKDAAVKTKDVVADATVTSEVKTKLLADTKVGGLKIDVDTKDNVVTLTGVVNSVEEKNEALRLARTTTGVKRVVDKLTVK
jgi:osmotically-inducible protein OsmY